DFTRLPTITPQLVLDLISKINPNNDKTLYFALPEALQNCEQLKKLKAPQLEEEFSKLSITVSPVVQKMLSTPQIQPSKLFGLPFRLQGHILSFLPAKEIMQLERTVTSWTYDLPLQIALRGKEDEVATTSLRSMLQKGVARIPSALEPIRDRVKKLDFSYLNITPEILEKIAEYFPNLEELNLQGATLLNPVDCMKVLQKFSYLQTLNLSASKITDEALQHISA